MDEQPVAFIYSWTVARGDEDRFRARWREVTLRLREQAGSLGSCLTRDADGTFVAFARWPTLATRDAAFAAFAPDEPWPGILAFEERRLTVEDDLLLAND